MKFDGRLAATSADAALYESFLQQSAREIFLDELGPVESPAWRALVQAADLSYSAQADHLLGREDSPFWDDVRTPAQEDKRRSSPVPWRRASPRWSSSSAPIVPAGSGAGCTATTGAATAPSWRPT